LDFSEFLLSRIKDIVFGSSRGNPEIALELEEYTLSGLELCLSIAES